MLDSDLEKFIAGGLLVSWLASRWYLSAKLQLLHKMLDHLSDSFDGLREYLYQIDPQFEDERVALNELFQGAKNDQPNLAGATHLNIVRRKEREGKRTLTTPFHNQN